MNRCLTSNELWFFPLFVLPFILHYAAQLMGSQFPTQGLNLGPRQWKWGVPGTGPEGVP